jgi:hypothetical protein
MWSMSADQYIKDAIYNINFHLEQMNKWLPSKKVTPFSSRYSPDIDTTPYLHESP